MNLLLMMLVVLGMHAGDGAESNIIAGAGAITYLGLKQSQTSKVYTNYQHQPYDNLPEFKRYNW